MDTKKCKTCGNEFLAKGKTVYCSSVCSPTRYNKTEIRTISCLNCEKECKTNRKNGKYCSFKCSRDYKNKEHSDIVRKRNNDKYDYVPACLICGLESTMLVKHIITKHKITVAEYRNKFNVGNSAIFHDSYITRLSENIKGERNPAYGRGGLLSPFSTKFIKYQKLDDSAKSDKIKETITKTITSRSLNSNDTTTVEYYMKNGVPYDKAIKLLAERQRTFSLDKCIERYGKVDGMAIWNNRQERWMTALYDKSKEEIVLMNKKKLQFMSQSFTSASSNPARTLFRYVQTYYPYRLFNFDDIITKNREVSILNEEIGRRYRLDFTDKLGWVIEFYGDYWHGNPTKYNGDQVLLSSGALYRDIWERDRVKEEYIKSLGYKLLIIWESDFKYNREETLQKCITFLES